MECERPGCSVDVLLVDPWACGFVAAEQLWVARAVAGARQVVCFSWRPVRQAMQATAGFGFDHYLSKQMDPELLVQRLVTIAQAGPWHGSGHAHRPRPTAGSTIDMPVMDVPAGRVNRGVAGLGSSALVGAVCPGEAAQGDRCSVSMLSPREVDVLRLVMEGLGNAEIAEALGLSVNTLKSYIRNLYRKIGAVNRSQAVRWGYENFDPDLHPSGA